MAPLKERAVDSSTELDHEKDEEEQAETDYHTDAHLEEEFPPEGFEVSLIFLTPDSIS